jgi:beta-galactosidase
MKISRFILTIVSVMLLGGVTAQEKLEPARSRIITYENQDKALSAIADSSAYYSRLNNIEGTNSYNDTFFFPFRWVGRSLFLHIEGCAAAGVVYVNNKQIGTFTDAKGHSEFDITKVAREGNNTIRIEFVAEDKMTESTTKDNSSIGIAYLTSEPKVRIRDLSVQTKINDQNGALQIGAIAKSHFKNPKKINIQFELYTPSGERIDIQTKEIDFENFSEDTVWFSTLVRDLDIWSADTPLFYVAVLSVEYEGFKTQYISTKVGFREVAFNDKELIINGKNISLGDVVEIPYKAEYAMGDNESKKKIEQLFLDLKSRGVKVITPADGQFSENFYDAADQIGIYIIDMAAFNPTPESEIFELPTFSKEVVDRITSRFISHRNHPSVIAFSMGNSPDGFNLCEAYLNIKKMQDSRPIMAENVRNMWNSDIYFTRDNSQPLYSDRPVLRIGSLNGAMAKQNNFRQIVIKSQDVTNQRLEITNNSDFINLSNYKLTFSITRGDKVLKSGEIQLLSSTTQQITIPIEGLKIRGKKSHILNVEITPKSHGMKNLASESFNLN